MFEQNAGYKVQGTIVVIVSHGHRVVSVVAIVAMVTGYKLQVAGCVKV